MIAGVVPSATAFGGDCSHPVVVVRPSVSSDDCISSANELLFDGPTS